jgi:integrase
VDEIQIKLRWPPTSSVEEAEMKKVGCYGSGFLSCIKRLSGTVIAYRWHEQGRERKRVLGPASKFKTEASAWKEVERLGLGQKGDLKTVNDLIKHWQKKEAARRASSTWQTYQGYIRKWVAPAWGSRELNEVKAVDVEDWLGDLELAPGSKKKIRDIMHLLYEHGIRHEQVDRNPISKVRQGGKRLETPIRLDVNQLRRLIGTLPRRERLMMLLDFGTGLRRGELSGLKWEDLDFGAKELTPARSIVNQQIGDVKTDASRKAIPLDEDLLDELLLWRAETPYAADSDYVFASPKKKGKQPYWMSRIMQHRIKPVAAKLGIPLKGWHTLRHSYTTLLRQNGNDPKVVQDLLRHATYNITANIYDSAVSKEKRKAHRKVLRLVTRTQTRTAQESGEEASA